MIKTVENFHVPKVGVNINILTINLGQQLVDHSIVNASVPSHGASRFANGIDFVEDDDMKTAVWSALLN